LNPKYFQQKNKYRNTRLTKYTLYLKYLIMNILCLGGGPAGLYFAVLMKQQNPANVITVVERNRPFDTFGWGVVLSDQTLANLQAPG
jgi:ribulose 1,5-bisphosphate synthetase/thiazole synthase